MTTTEVAKTSKAIRGITSTVRTHLDAVERAREIYLAQIKRAEADYFERIKHATELVAGADAPPPAAGPNANAEAAPLST